MGLIAAAAWSGTSLKFAADDDAALASPLAEVREQALDRLLRTRATTPNLLEHLGALLDDKDLYLAGKAATALSLRGAAAFVTVSGLLQRGSPQQRWGAAVALYKTSADTQRFVPALAQALMADDDR